jgi:hypothetical protein
MKNDAHALPRTGVEQASTNARVTIKRISKEECSSLSATDGPFNVEHLNTFDINGDRFIATPSARVQCLAHPT